MRFPSERFAYELGALVAISPTGIVGADSCRGKVTGRIENIDGSLGYIVSVWSRQQGAVIRHMVHAADIVRPADLGVQVV